MENKVKIYERISRMYSEYNMTAEVSLNEPDVCAVDFEIYSYEKNEELSKTSFLKTIEEIINRLREINEKLETIERFEKLMKKN